jgi:uncharacterized protein (TIGR00369 family)
MPPFYSFMGFEVDPSTEKAIVTLPARDGLSGSRGHVHGGAISSLADVAMSRAVRLARPGIQGLATIDLLVRFVGPAYGLVRAEASVIGGGQSVLSLVSTVSDADGSTVAHATGAVRLFWPGGKNPQIKEG